MFKNIYTLQRRTVFIVGKGLNHKCNLHGQTTIQQRATITKRVFTTTSPPQQPITSTNETNNKYDDTKNDDTQKTVGVTTLLQSVVDTSTKGIGQVIFLNSKQSGQIILGSLAIGDPFLAGMAALGTITSTTLAQYISLPTKDTIDNGLYSYNGCLIGCASSVFLTSTFTTTSSLVLASTALTITGAASATVATTILGKMCNPMPQWTYAFNFVMLTALLRIQPLAPATSSSTTESTTDAVIDVTTTSTISTLDILLSPLTGLSQIFVVQSAWTGAGIVAAIASYSPGLAYHAIMGSTIGCLMGSLVYNVPIADVTAGLWGYNAALTSLGVGVFFVPSKQSTVLSITGAIATSAIFGAMQPAFTSTPCLTLPFCVTMSACWLLGTPSIQHGITTSLIPGLLLASNPHSPEKNSL